MSGTPKRLEEIEDACKYGHIYERDTLWLCARLRDALAVIGALAPMARLREPGLVVYDKTVEIPEVLAAYRRLFEEEVERG